MNKIKRYWDEENKIAANIFGIDITQRVYNRMKKDPEIIEDNLILRYANDYVYRGNPKFANDYYVEGVIKNPEALKGIYSLIKKNEMIFLPLYITRKNKEDGDGWTRIIFRHKNSGISLKVYINTKGDNLEHLESYTRVDCKVLNNKLRIIGIYRNKEVK